MLCLSYEASEGRGSGKEKEIRVILSLLQSSGIAARETKQLLAVFIVVVETAGEADRSDIRFQFFGTYS